MFPLLLSISPLLSFQNVFLPLKQPYEQQTPVSMVQHGPGFGYNQAHFQPGHGQHAVMMRQKSIGNSSSHGNISACSVYECVSV